MTAIPTLLFFSFLLTFPCAESFLKESQEDGNVPAVTLAGVAPGWVSQAAKGCPRKVGPQQPDVLPGLRSLRHLVLCSPLSCRTRFVGAESVVTGPLLPEIPRSCDHPAGAPSPQQRGEKGASPPPPPVSAGTGGTRCPGGQPQTAAAPAAGARGCLAQAVARVGGWRSEEGQVFDTHYSDTVVKISPQRGNWQRCGRAEVSSHGSLVQQGRMLLPALCSPWHGPVQDTHRGWGVRRR